MIQPHSTAPTGTVETLATRYAPRDFIAGTAVLCRNNAPLATLATALLSAGIPVNVLGRDLGVGLEKLLSELRPDSLRELRRNADHHIAEASRRYAAKPWKLAAITDRVAALCAIARGCDEVSDLAARLKTLFVATAPEDRCTLSSIHKAKGLEWDTVYILDRHLMPSRWAESEWELTQERNLEYVAVTRAKLNLYFIDSKS